MCPGFQFQSFVCVQVESGRSAVYCYDDAQLQTHLASLGTASRSIQRFKVGSGLNLWIYMPRK